MVLYQVAGPSAGATLVKQGSVTRALPQSIGSKVFFVLLEAPRSHCGSPMALPPGHIR
jgi:hypothetical protein